MHITERQTLLLFSLSSTLRLPFSQLLVAEAIIQLGQSNQFIEPEKWYPHFNAYQTELVLNDLVNYRCSWCIILLFKKAGYSRISLSLLKIYMAVRYYLLLFHYKMSLECTLGLYDPNRRLLAPHSWFIQSHIASHPMEYRPVLIGNSSKL